MERGRGEAFTNAVFEAAGVLFGENGFHETSTDQLAAHLGISKPTLYKYGASKADILQGVVARHYERLLAESRRIADADAPPLTQLQEMFLFQTHYAIKHRLEIRIIEAEQRRLPNPGQIELMAGEYISFLKNLIVSLQKSEKLRDDIPLELFARSFVALALGPCKWFIHKPDGLAEDEVVDAAWRLFMQGAMRSSAANSGN